MVVRSDACEVDGAFFNNLLKRRHVTDFLIYIIY